MWPCYGVYITVYTARTSCLCTLSANALCYPTQLRLVCHPHTCAPMNGFQQPVHSASSVFSCKKAQAVSPSYAQTKAQMDHPQIIL